MFCCGECNTNGVDSLYCADCGAALGLATVEHVDNQFAPEVDNIGPPSINPHLDSDDSSRGVECNSVNVVDTPGEVDINGLPIAPSINPHLDSDDSFRCVECNTVKDSSRCVECNIANVVDSIYFADCWATLDLATEGHVDKHFAPEVDNIGLHTAPSINLHLDSDDSFRGVECNTVNVAATRLGSA